MHSFILIHIDKIFVFFLNNSIECLHPKYRECNPTMEILKNTLLFDYPTAPLGFYCVYDFQEMNNDMENENKCNPKIGWADFFTFNILLLLVIPNNSSITIRACIAFGCIISAQFGDMCTSFLMSYTNSDYLPAVPLPTIAVTAYAIVINAIIEYSNVDCEDLLK